MEDVTLLKMLAEHEHTERERIRDYESFANRCPDPLVRYLMSMIIEDEHRHHALVQKLTSALTEGRPDEWLLGRHRPGWVPSSQDLVTIEESIEAEHLAAARSEATADAYGPGPVRSLFLAMAHDSRKHAEILGAVDARMQALTKVTAALASDAAVVGGLIRSAAARVEEPARGGTPLDTALSELRRFIFVTEGVVVGALDEARWESHLQIVLHAHALLWDLLDEIQESRMPPSQYGRVVEGLHRITTTFDELQETLVSAIYPAVADQLRDADRETFLRQLEVAVVPTEWLPSACGTSEGDSHDAN